MTITVSYTGLWSEVIGLTPERVRDSHRHQLEALRAERPVLPRSAKGWSIRAADAPPFLAEVLVGQIDGRTARTCTWRNTKKQWCPGNEYVFLDPGHCHFRRPAAEGWHPARGHRPAMPVMVNAGSLFLAIPPWPAREPSRCGTNEPTEDDMKYVVLICATWASEGCATCR